MPTIRAYPWGAPGHCMGALVEELLTAGHEVQWLVAPIDGDHPEVARLKARGARVERLPEERPGYVRWAPLRWRLRELAGVPTLRRVVGRFGPDHIFVNQGTTWCSLQREIREILDPMDGQYSLICHLGRPDGFPKECSPDTAFRFMKKAKRVFFNSIWTQRVAEEQMGAKFTNHLLFQYPVRFGFEQPLPWPDSPLPRIGMVNRIDIRHKGLDLAVQASSILKQRGIAHLITIAGRGSDEEKLRRLIRENSVENEVRMEPYTENLDRFWKQHEILLLPSRYEGLAVSMIEAMGFGRPVIRTPFGGCEEWLEEGVNGWICREATAEEVATTLQKALQARSLWREMGGSAHCRIKKNLDPRPGRVFLESLK